MHLNELAPWEELEQFLLPQTTVTPSIAVGAQILPANPQRVVLLISEASGSGIQISPGGVVPGSPGYILTLTYPVVEWTHKDHPGLPQSSWWNTATGAAVFTYTELILREGVLLSGLAPWQELPYYNLPLVTDQGLIASKGLIVAANPQRVVLIIWTTAGVNTPIAPQVLAAAGNGWTLTTTNPNVIWTHKDHPGLPQAPWFNMSGSAATFGTIEIVIRQEPADSLL